VLNSFVPQKVLKLCADLLSSSSIAALCFSFAVVEILRFDFELLKAVKGIALLFHDI
jgi:hypothetical protein